MEVADGIVACEPWPETGFRADCESHEAHFVGTPGCAPVGASCPTGDFAADLPADRLVLYVLASAVSGGDGTEASPLAEIGPALTAVSSAMVIAVGKGTYDEVLVLPADVTLHGACTQDTIVQSSSPDDREAVLAVRNGGVVLRDLRIGRSMRAGVRVDGGSAVLRGIAVHRTAGIGVLVLAGGTLVAEDVLIRETARRVSDAAFGRGLGVQGSSATVRRGAIEANFDVGVFASDAGAVVELEDVSIRDTEPAADGTNGTGITAQLDAVVTATRCVLEANRFLGVNAGASATTVRLTDTIVRNTASTPLGSEGTGAAFFAGARGELIRVLFADNQAVGLLVGGAGSSADAEDVVVVDTRGRESDQAFGTGIEISTGASLTARAVHLERNHFISLLANLAGTTVTAVDLTVRDTRPNENNGANGLGIVVQSGAEASFTRALVRQSREVGVRVFGEAARLTAADLTISDTLPMEADGSSGRGLVATLGATVEVERALVEGAHDVGVIASEVETSLTLEDTVVREVSSRADDGSTGRGIQIQNAACASLTRVSIEEVHDFGLIAAGGSTTVSGDSVYVRDVLGRESDHLFGRGVEMNLGASAVLSDLRVERTRGMGVAVLRSAASVQITDARIVDILQRDCVDLTGCDPRSIGVGAYSTGRLDLSGFEVRGTELCGLLVLDAELDVRRGVVSDSPIGACVQVDDYDLARLTEEVVFIDNGINLQATELPVPDPGGTTAIESGP